MDYALYRELLQNSADARASSVVISFKSVSGNATSPEVIESLQEAPVDRLTVSNDGQRFEEDDWNRLREIAKGNPNEAKIGAFGVGFYSVFELTDEPLVHSGTQAMSFYYVEDQLRYRKDTVNSSSEWTVIDLPYRSPGSLPNLVSFTAFLTQSFMLVPLSSITLEVDGTKLLQLSKTSSPTNEWTIPRHLSLKSPDNILSLKSVTSEAFQVNVKYMNVTQINTSGARANILNFGKKLLSSFITTSESPSDITEVTCFLRKITGTVNVHVSRNFAQKMKETVMKPPPKEAVISMLSHSRAERNESEIKPPLSDYIFPKEYNDAKIYVGFPTKQSTSMKSHLAMSQLIPTMERTAIDMSNSFVKTWNEQMLYMAGVLSRVVYEKEMYDLSNSGNEKELPEHVIEDATYIMNKFAFHRSTPDAIVGKWVASGFWRSSSVFPVPSQLGIYPSKKVVYAGDAANFIKNIPVLPEEVFSKANEFIEKAQMLGLIEEISPEDVIREVQSRTFNLSDLKLFIIWCVNSLRNESLNMQQVRNILNNAVVADEKNTYQLGLIKSYQLKQVIEDDLPLPPSCIRQDFVSSISLSDLELLGWKQLTVVQWVEYVVANMQNLPVEQNLSLSVGFAKQVLKKISEYWYSIKSPEQEKIVQLLSNVSCIPTQLGMKLPSESYLMEIPMFPHLPVRSKDLPVSDKMLLSLGLRESVDMAFVLKLLHNPQPGFEWSTYDVTKYLTSNKNKLKSTDWQLLRTSSFFENQRSSPEKGANRRLYKAHELYSPNQQLMELGFNSLKWEQTWDDSSNEAGLLFNIGLKRGPTISELFTRGSESTENAKIALQYYLDNFSRNGYTDQAAGKVQAKVIPCSTNGNIVSLESPSSCYSSQEIESFGFPIVQKRFRAEAWKFGVQEAPKAHLLVNSIIQDPPKSHTEAESKFSYLSRRANELSSLTIQNLQNSKIIPVETEKKVDYYFPGRIFLELPRSQGGDGNSSIRYFKRLFNYVKFSDSAIPFLLKAGVRYAPKLPEIIRMVIADPYTAYNEAGGRENYEKFLGEVAASWSSLSTDKSLVTQMQRSKFLIGLIVEKESTKNEDDEDDDTKETERVSLVSIDEVAIVDDVIAFNWFKKYIKTVPQVKPLETFYHQLGAVELSKISYENVTRGNTINNTDTSTKLEKHLLERCTLFLEGRTDTSSSTAKRALQGISIQLVTSIEVVRQAILGSVRTPVFRESISASFDQRRPKELFVVIDKNSGWTVDWYDLSKAVVKLILPKPNPESVIVLETYLSSDLGILRKKGINVDRLLKEKQREKEQADQERARLQKEAEERRQQEIEHQRKIQESQPKAEDTTANRDTSNDSQDSSLIPHKPSNSKLSETSTGAESGTSSGFFNRLLKKSTSNSSSTHNQKRLQSSSSSSGGGQNNPEGLQTGESTSRRLQQAVQQSKPFTGRELNSRVVDVDDKAVEFSCQTVSPTELKYATRLPGGPSCYVTKHGSNSTLSDSEMMEASRFKTVLFKMSQVS